MRSRQYWYRGPREETFPKSEVERWASFDEVGGEVLLMILEDIVVLAGEMRRLSLYKISWNELCCNEITMKMENAPSPFCKRSWDVL